MEVIDMHPGVGPPLVHHVVYERLERRFLFHIIE